jgi:hypothetical protein
MYSIVFQQVLNLVYELPEDGTDVSKHVGVVKDYTDMFIICAFVWLYKLTF